MIMQRAATACWIGALIAAAFAVYHGIRMSQDLKDPIGKPTTIPLMVRDDELETEAGSRHRSRFYFWIVLFFLLCVAGAVLINSYHNMVAR